ncbi:hypothetical protein Plano_1536 [Planococcus sp. PAMC 21323]|uniref:TVP38/TMEM64 family protein n=1 Tax=Planococcus sp. PAMC 21323 TaxID=1526927 RepID=UPI000585E195|nr:VTT domain-containing protein [Planococcus sp. PAMC 21323]AIY05501.1 hypothetical protein Plano_1536 [Planococcus sp. PAMC 21323]
MLIVSLYFGIEIFFLLLINIAVGAIGFIPSVLITAVNIQSFGLYGGAILTFSGEIIGALLGFYLYRFGFSKIKPNWKRHRIWQKLQKQSTRQVFSMVIILRLLPFMPSGLVTAGAALTPISGKLFWLASTIGKIPAVLLELAAVYGVTQLAPKSVQSVLFCSVLIVSLVLWRKSIKQKKTLQSFD